MTKTPPTSAPLTLFDASQFEFEADADAKTPMRPPPCGPHVSRFAAAVAAKRLASSAESATARRRRAKARLAKRRYLADAEGYELMEQVRRGLQLVAE